MAANVERLLTINDLAAFPDDNGNRYELIEGELYVSRSPGLPHQLVLHNLQVQLAKYLEAKPIGVLVPGVGTIFSIYDAVIPDIVSSATSVSSRSLRKKKSSPLPILWLKYFREARRIGNATFKSSGSYTQNTVWLNIGLSTGKSLSSNLSAGR